VSAAKKNYRLAVDVQSREGHSDLLYVVNENFAWRQLQQLEGLCAGFTALDEIDEIAVDYFRQGLFSFSEMTPLAPNAPGRSNPFERLVEKYVNLAMSSAGATVYAFGSRFGPRKGKDRIFGFSPQLGVCNIHRNQGSVAQFQADEGVFRDGMLVLHLPEKKRWIAISVAFQSQAIHTDDRTGRRLAAVAAGASGGQEIFPVKKKRRT
jgi:uncharacterized protein YukJ